MKAAKKNFDHADDAYARSMKIMKFPIQNESVFTDVNTEYDIF